MNIFCIEQNYFLDKPEQPGNNSRMAIFIKPGSALLQAGTSFFHPEFASELYGGCELVLHISKNGNNIPEQLAEDYYDSISAGINFTALNQDELKEANLSWEKIKAWDHSSVVGNWMPTSGFKDKKDINFCWYRNRKLMQLGNSGLMIYNFNKIISEISKSFPVGNGDLIFTGTPAGISRVEPGDKLELFIEDDSVLEFQVELSV